MFDWDPARRLQPEQYRKVVPYEEEEYPEGRELPPGEGLGGLLSPGREEGYAESEDIEPEYRFIEDEPVVEEPEVAEGVREPKEGWWSRRGREKKEREEEYLRASQERAAERGWPIPETYDQAVRMKEREVRAFKLGERVEEAGRKKKLTELSKERWQLRKQKLEVTEKAAKGLGKAVGRAATLGGVPSVQKPGGIRDMYFGRAKKGLYTPSAPADVSGQLDLSRLREASVLEVPRTGTDLGFARKLVSPGGQRLKGGFDLTFLREMSTPRNLPRVEQAAFAEIRANHDRDTARHVGQELAKLGFSRVESERAIKGLLQKGYITKAKDFRGEEPILEVVQR